MRDVCPECPYRRKDSFNRYAPPVPDAHFELTNAGQVMACHMSQREQWARGDQRGLRQCRGLAIFRANLGRPDADSGIDPDHETVFATEDEARAAWDAFHIIGGVVGVLAEHGLTAEATALAESLIGAGAIDTIVRRAERMAPGQTARSRRGRRGPTQRMTD
jgi:hypothetical protein